MCRSWRRMNAREEIHGLSRANVDMGAQSVACEGAADQLSAP